MNLLVVLPVLVPLSAAALGLLAWPRPRLQRAIGVVGSLGLLVTGVALLQRTWSGAVLHSTLGGWSAPFGITLRIDLLGALMITLAGLMGAAAAVTALRSIDRRREELGFHPLLQGLLLGVSGAFSTGDMFNLYVWFEVMLISSFALLSLGASRAQLLGGARYVVLNLLSSLLFLTALGFLYGMARSLDMADLAVRLPALQSEHPQLVLAASGLLFVSFLLKAGVFPLYFWLPPSYPTAPTAVAAVFAGLLTKVGVYALIRVHGSVMPSSPLLFEVALVLGALTMVLGVLGAVAQMDLRRILSFHILSQIGYMVVAFGLLVSEEPAVRRLGVAAAILYITHHIIVKTNLFLVGGLVRELGGSFDLARLGGLRGRTPWLAALFAVPALSLAGIPPLSGFWAKLAVLEAAVAAGRPVIVAVAAGAGLLTLLSMLKIWNQAFWREAPGELAADAGAGSEDRAGRWALVVPVVVLALCTLAIGFYAEPFVAAAGRAADVLLTVPSMAMEVGR